jgi:hypothetical protein
MTPTMIFCIGYLLPAIVFFVLCCWDEIDCYDQLSLSGLMFAIVCAIVPVINWLAVCSILNHLNNKRELISWNFVIYKRKK